MTHIESSFLSKVILIIKTKFAIIEICMHINDYELFSLKLLKQ